MSDAVRHPCSDFMDMLRRLINYRIIIIIILRFLTFFLNFNLNVFYIYGMDTIRSKSDC